MEVDLAAAYGRLAERARRTTAIVAEVLAVVGGAWLGLSLDNVWIDYRQSSAEATRALNDDRPVPFLGLTELAHLLPVLVIAIAIAGLVLTRQYEVAQKCYEDAASPGRPTPTINTELPSRRSLRGLLKRFLSGGL